MNERASSRRMNEWVIGRSVAREWNRVMERQDWEQAAKRKRALLKGIRECSINLT